MQKKWIALIVVFTLSCLAICISVPVYRNRIMGKEMVKVQGGQISIGNGNESAQYDFEIKTFTISPYEVTNELFVEVYNQGIRWHVATVKDGEIWFDPEYKRVFQFALLDTGIEGCKIRYNNGKLSTEPGTEKLPVVGVSWYGAAMFCNLLSRIEGRDEVYDIIDWVHKKNAKGYRLPTYEEWEYAARGGIMSKGYTYSGSDDAYEVGWVQQNSNGSVHPVGMKKPNELGLYDMSGNLHEFTTEVFSPLRNEYYKPDENGFGTNGGLLTSNRIWRGGAWNKQPVSVYFFRQCIDQPPALLGYPDIGFRLVLDR